MDCAALPFACGPVLPLIPSLSYPMSQHARTHPELYTSTTPPANDAACAAMFELRAVRAQVETLTERAEDLDARWHALEREIAENAAKLDEARRELARFDEPY